MEYTELTSCVTMFNKYLPSFPSKIQKLPAFKRHTRTQPCEYEETVNGKVLTAFLMKLESFCRPSRKCAGNAPECVRTRRFNVGFRTRRYVDGDVAPTNETGFHVRQPRR